MLFILYLYSICFFIFFFFSSRRRHTRCLSDWSSDVCSSDLSRFTGVRNTRLEGTTPIVGVRMELLVNFGPAFAIIQTFVDFQSQLSPRRSEERRVGKECRSRWSTYHSKKKKNELRRKKREIR